METNPREVNVYVLPDGSVPFDEWLNGLRDRRAKAAIDQRITRVRLGLLGDCQRVGNGVLELRVDVGPGYRIYCVDDGREILVLCAGSKKTQTADIARAKLYWNAYQVEKKHNA